MSKLTEQMTNSANTGVEAIKGIANASFDGIGQLTVLNLQTARSAIESNAETIAALFAVRSIDDFKALQMPVANAALEQSLNYHRRAYEIYNESASAVVQIVEGQVNVAKGEIVSTVSQVWQKRPATFDSTAESVKSLVRSIFDKWQQVAVPAVKTVEKMIQPAIGLLPAKV